MTMCAHLFMHLPCLQGIDCPMTAAFMDAVIYYGGGSPRTFKNAICVFEHNPGECLLRTNSTKV